MLSTSLTKPSPLSSDRSVVWSIAFLVGLGLAFGLLAGCAPEEAMPAAEEIRPKRSEAPPGAIETLPEKTRLVFEFPTGWQSETPTSSMRMAQASVPGSDGNAQLAVFFFGPGQGGGVEANVERWIGQMEAAPGSEAERTTMDVGRLSIHTVSLDGTLLPAGFGMGPSEPQPNSSLLGAVVEGPGGPWFFKMTGPAATVKAAQPAFIDMMNALTIESDA